MGNCRRSDGLYAESRIHMEDVVSRGKSGWPRKGLWTEMLRAVVSVLRCGCADLRERDSAAQSNLAVGSIDPVKKGTRQVSREPTALAAGVRMVASTPGTPDASACGSGES